jgi:AraC-like DNA-binding protein
VGRHNYPRPSIIPPEAVARFGPASEPSRQVSALNIHLMCGVLREYGLDPVPLLRNAKIPLDVLEAPDRCIGWHQELIFQEELASRTLYLPEIWIEIGRRYTYPAYAEFGMAMITAPSLRHFQDVAQFGYGVGQYNVVFDDHGSTGIEFTLPPQIDRDDAFFRFIIVREVVTGVAFYDDLWQARFPFVRVELPLNSLPKGLSEAANAPLIPGSTSLRWIWPANLLDVPLPRSNVMLHEEYVRRLQHSRNVGNVRELDEQILAILEQPGNAGLSLPEIAVRLALATRTVQRRLNENKISFSTLRNAARMREGSRLLSSSGMPISEIARQLGYVEVASFSNAFRRWTGYSPSQFRHRNGAHQEVALENSPAYRAGE